MELSHGHDYCGGVEVYRSDGWASTRKASGQFVAGGALMGTVVVVRKWKRGDWKEWSTGRTLVKIETAL
jgi:hypothetical protein